MRDGVGVGESWAMGNGELREDAAGPGEKSLAEPRRAQRDVGVGEKAVEGVDGVSTLEVMRGANSNIACSSWLDGLSF